MSRSAGLEPAAAATGDEPDGKAGIEPECSSEHVAHRGAAGPGGGTRQGARGARTALARQTPAIMLERAGECDERIGRVRKAVGRHRLSAAYQPCQLGTVRPQAGRDAHDLAQRNLALERALEIAAPLRGLARVHALEQQRLAEIPPFGDTQQPRPEVVVLAFGELRVVAKAAAIERPAVDDHRRVEERAREQQLPADVRVPGRHVMEPRGAAARVQLERARAQKREIGRRPQNGELPLEPRRHGDVIGVEPRDVASHSGIETAVQRPRQPELRVVAKHDQPRVVDLREQLGRAVGGGVVDDDDLDGLERLAKQAANSRTERPGTVMGREHA